MNDSTGAPDLSSAMSLLKQRYRDEIERAIDNVKRTDLDKWFRKQWYKAAARRRRQSRSPWHRQQVSGACGHGGKDGQ